VTTPDIIRFCRFARANGFSAGVTETLAAVEAVRSVDAESARFALRGALCSSKTEWDAFDGLYESFLRPRTPPLLRRTDARGVWMLTGRSSESAAGGAEREVSGAGVHARLKNMDFSTLRQDDQRPLEQLAERLLHRMSWRLSRRLNAAQLRDRIDLRRTIRKSIAHGGEPFDLRYKGRKRQQARVVMLIDISGSMSVYSLFFLRFAHAMHRHFKRADTFVFSTTLVNVGRLLRSRKIPDALAALAGCAADWAGGTKIGESLGDLNRRYAALLARDAVFLILSDGWDTGDPGRMAAELAAIQKKVRRVIFLNPLLGLADYQPATEAMAKALAYTDVFAPAHSLESLLELEKHLSHV
jgi:uncharacterized protein with von Willebrand factor type A (vWA) domain